MWFRKKAVKANFLGCVGCGCLMRKARKTVEVEKQEGSLLDTGSTITWYIGSEPLEPGLSFESYCGRCAPPYDVKTVAGSKTTFYRKEPSKKIEVTEKGKRVMGGK